MNKKGFGPVERRANLVALSTIGTLGPSTAVGLGGSSGAVVRQPVMSQPPLVVNDPVYKPVVFVPTEDKPVSSGFSPISDVVITEPVVTQPVVTQPVVTQPVVTKPVVTKPVVTQPVFTKPVDDLPVAVQPVISDDMVADPPVFIRPGFQPISPITDDLVSVVPDKSPVIDRAEVHLPEGGCHPECPRRDYGDLFTGPAVIVDSPTTTVTLPKAKKSSIPTWVWIAAAGVLGFVLLNKKK